MLQSTQITVLGDEIESVLTAVSAARQGAQVTLVRHSTGLLGGLSSRGGLSYMDITPAYQAPLFNEFLERAGVVRVALEAHRCHTTLEAMLRQADVSIISGLPPQVMLDAEGQIEGLFLDAGHTLQAQIYLDATPDGDIARQAGVPYIEGLGGLFGARDNFLGVSPVFHIAGVRKDDLQAFEARLRQHPEMPQWLDTALPYHDPALRAEYLTRPTYSPEAMDYLDILNPAIGIAYHHWKFGEVESYPTTQTWIDGGNISLLPDGTMGFNGLVTRIPNFQELLALSHGKPMPEYLLAELQAFERFLQEAAGLKGAQVIPPQELYVRQTLNLLSKAMMTAESAIRGGVPADQAIGTFSYWLDLRGVVLSQYFPGEHLPKPVFNVGLDVALPQSPKLQNLAFVSRAAGYGPLGQGSGRIVQHNAMLGEAIGIAAALACQAATPIGSVPIESIQSALRRRNIISTPLAGHKTWSGEQIEQSQALHTERQLVQEAYFKHLV